MESMPGHGQVKNLPPQGTGTRHVGNSLLGRRESHRLHAFLIIQRWARHLPIRAVWSYDVEDEDTEYSR